MAKRGRRATSVLRVVGVGASAGGLEPLRQLVARLPREGGLAIIILQHLPASQTGQLARLLASVTALPVIDVKTKQRVVAGSIFVIPQRSSVTLVRGAVVIEPAKARTRPTLPIDALFGSLAKTLGERAIGVILSGTAQDGTAGLRAIRDAGGRTFAQDPSTARFDEMPRSAIAAGVAEVVAPPAQIAERLAALGRSARPARARAKEALPAIDRVLGQLREASGIDFTSYKRTTIERRLARRLTKLGLASLDDYSGYLESHPGEAAAVYEDLLIHVTEFFRDAPILDKLVAQLVDHLQGTPATVPLRVWVPGCSTGEEVYSLAILLIEAFGPSRSLQLFGSDLSEHAIEIARAGHYPDAIAAQVGAARLARFFRRDDGGYRIQRDVRDRCVFVRHDLVTDPPISKLDLVSCRNLLIYLGPELQQRVLPLFHYALNQPGYLLLGPAETVAGFENLFEPVDISARIYVRKPAVRDSLTFPMARQLGRQPWRAPEGAPAHADLQVDVDHVLLARYAPPCVIVDENLDVIHFRGRTGPYLEAPPGRPQINVLKMARDALASELPVAIQRARRTGEPVRRENISVVDAGVRRRFHLDVIPLRATDDGQRHYLLVFEPAAATAGKAVKGAAHAAGSRGELARVRDELAATKQYLSSVIVQHRTTSEELGVANEELQSTNEELQSTNEELQTAKEELQSSNEELETVNEELQHGNARLREVNDDLVNLLASVDIAVIMVDANRHVRRFTPKARTVMKLIPGHIGQPISDVMPAVAVPTLDDDIKQVIETLAIHESEVVHADGTVYRMQIRPYRTADHKIGGAVLAFVDITALRAARDYTAAIVETVPSPVAVIDERLHIQSANHAFRTAFGAAPVDRELLDLGDWRLPGLRERLATAFDRGTGFDDLDVEYRGSHGERVLRLSARPLPEADHRTLFLLGVADITESRRVEEARQTAAREHDDFLDAVSHELRTPLSAILLWAEALRDLPSDDPRRGHGIDTIIECAKSEAQLVEDLLELAMSRTGDLPVGFEAVDAAAIVDECLAKARADADGKQVAFETAVSARPRVRAEPRRLRQIVSTVLGNALKFTPAGGQIWTTVAVQDGMMVLRVRDTGAGVAPEFLPHVFEPFSRADRSTTRTHGGLGIGLALVRHLVTRLGGTIEVASPGVSEGTTFTVRLPVADADGDAA